MSTQPTTTDRIPSTSSAAPMPVALVAMAMMPPMNSARPTGSVMTEARTRPFMFGSGIIEPSTSALPRGESPLS
jgi:hypothetical protein